jgi:predicted  nucleic acid-binding Zn-ribbon protein
MNTPAIQNYKHEIDILRGEIASVRNLLELASNELEAAARVQVQMIEALKAVQNAAMSTDPNAASTYVPHKIRAQVDAALQAAGVTP